MSNHTSIPEEELALFKKLPGLKVIFDVGSRDDTDYLKLRPKAICHLFEPNQDFFKELKDNVNGNPRAVLNNVGLSNKAGKFKYNDGIQTMEGSEAWAGSGARTVRAITLDRYAKGHGIERIDFLKIDTEGNDYKVLLGAKNTLPNIRFIQYEHWSNQEEYYGLLEPMFHLEPIGYRNVLCINKELVPKRTLNRLVKYIKDNKLYELA